jgi:hypothetical protein
MEEIKFYRYEAVQYAVLGFDGDFEPPKFIDPKIELRTYSLLKETPKGYWVSYGSFGSSYLRGKGKWISKTAKKRFAYTNKEEALNNFIKRTEKRLKILQDDVLHCKIAIEKAKKINL